MTDLYKKSFSKKAMLWLFAVAIVLPPYFLVFSPSVFARLQETVRDLGNSVINESNKYAFIGIIPEKGSEVFFFDGENNIRITNNGVTDGSVQYDEFSNKIVFQSLIKGIWHIFLYDIETNTTVQLSYEGANNVDPKISKDQVIWKSWIDGNWEIYLYDGVLSQRLTFNEDHDIDPVISEGYVAWRGYEGDQPGDSKNEIKPENYKILIFDSSAKNTKHLTTSKRLNNSVSIEYPYVVWQTNDGNDEEIVVHNILANTIALLTNNDHDDLAPQISGGELKWLEYIKEELKKPPPNVVQEDGKDKLKPQITDSGYTQEIDPDNPPFWWDDPLTKCPDRTLICTYRDDKFISFVNTCFAIQTEAQILHEGACDGSEEIPGSSKESPIETESDQDTTASQSSPPPTGGGGTDLTEPASPSFEITPTPIESPEPTPESEPSPLVSPSESFETTVSPTPSEDPLPGETTEETTQEDPFSEPGDYVNSGSFDEEGDLVIEEHLPLELVEEESDQPNQESGSLPIVEDFVEPVVFEESALMEAGETISDSIIGTIETTANVLIKLLPGNDENQEEKSADEAPIVNEPPKEIIEVIQEPIK